jgi:hypothetical protein
MKVDIQIDEHAILSAVRHCIMVGIKPTINNVKKEIRVMATKYGECWVVEPTFDDIEGEIIDWETANNQAEIIAPKYYDKIY